MKSTHIIYICDASDQEMDEMVDYIVSNNIHVMKYSNTDVSDASPIYDMVAQFVFYNEIDALAFKLKFR